MYHEDDLIDLSDDIHLAVTATPAVEEVNPVTPFTSSGAPNPDDYNLPTLEEYMAQQGFMDTTAVWETTGDWAAVEEAHAYNVRKSMAEGGIKSKKSRRLARMGSVLPASMWAALTSKAAASSPSPSPLVTAPSSASPSMTPASLASPSTSMTPASAASPSPSSISSTSSTLTLSSTPAKTINELMAEKKNLDVAHAAAPRSAW